MLSGHVQCFVGLYRVPHPRLSLDLDRFPLKAIRHQHTSLMSNTQQTHYHANNYSYWQNRRRLSGATALAGLSLPLCFIGPIRSTHFALSDILSVTGLKALSASLASFGLRVLASTADALLTEPNKLYFVARLS